MAVDYHNRWLSLPWLCWECCLLFTVGCELLPSYDCVFGLLLFPWFWVAVSCFGHVRANNNSEFPCRLELCLTFRLGLSPVVLLSSQGCEGIVLLQYAVVGLRTVLAWPIVEGLVNPVVLV